MDSYVRKGHCDHEESTPGCEVCRLVDFSHEWREAANEHKKCEHDINNAQERLVDQALTAAQREDIERGLEIATEQSCQWDQHMEKLFEIVASCVDAVRKVTDNHPKPWAKEFEKQTRVNVAHLDAIFDAIYPDSRAFRSADRSLNLPFRGLDRSKISATPDYLLSEGTGFEMFLIAGRKLGWEGAPRLPTTAVGERLLDLAFMSPGRAIRMFGLPEDPGDDPIREDDLSASLQDCSMVAPAADEEADAPATAPRTESEYRAQDSEHPPTISALSAESQWKLVGPKRYIKFAGLLANAYNKLANTPAPAVAPSEQPKERNLKEGAETDADTDPQPAVAEPEVAKPDVAKPDFAGLTNWIAESERAWPQHHFGEQILPKWKSDSEKRDQTITEKLTAATSKLRLTDADLGIPPPSDFNTQLPLMRKDLVRLKLAKK